jgi:hypothetical protein
MLTNNRFSILVKATEADAARLKSIKKAARRAQHSSAKAAKLALAQMRKVELQHQLYDKLRFPFLLSDYRLAVVYKVITLEPESQYEALLTQLNQLHQAALFYVVICQDNDIAFDLEDLKKYVRPFHTLDQGMVNLLLDSKSKYAINLRSLPKTRLTAHLQRTYNDLNCYQQLACDYYDKLNQLNLYLYVMGVLDHKPLRNEISLKLIENGVNYACDSLINVVRECRQQAPEHLNRLLTSAMTFFSRITNTSTPKDLTYKPKRMTRR